MKTEIIKLKTRNFKTWNSRFICRFILQIHFYIQLSFSGLLPLDLVIVSWGGDFVLIYTMWFDFLFTLKMSNVAKKWINPSCFSSLNWFTEMKSKWTLKLFLVMEDEIFSSRTCKCYLNVYLCKLYNSNIFV